MQCWRAQHLLKNNFSYRERRFGSGVIASAAHRRRDVQNRQCVICAEHAKHRGNRPNPPFRLRLLFLYTSQGLFLFSVFVFVCPPRDFLSWIFDFSHSLLSAVSARQLPVVRLRFRCCREKRSSRRGVDARSDAAACFHHLIRKCANVQITRPSGRWPIMALRCSGRERVRQAAIKTKQKTKKNKKRKSKKELDRSLSHLTLLMIVSAGSVSLQRGDCAIDRIQTI